MINRMDQSTLIKILKKSPNLVSLYVPTIRHANHELIPVLNEYCKHLSRLHIESIPIEESSLLNVFLGRLKSVVIEQADAEAWLPLLTRHPKLYSLAIGPELFETPLGLEFVRQNKQLQGLKRVDP